MKISKEEFQRRMNFYTLYIPRLNWFSLEEREELVLKADENARIYQSAFLPILENLTFIRSIIEGKRDIL